MDRHGTSFKEAAQQLFREEILALDHNKESYRAFGELSKELDLILNNDYIDGMRYVEQKHREDQESAKANEEDVQLKIAPPPPPAKGKRPSQAPDAQAKRRRM